MCPACIAAAAVTAAKVASLGGLAAFGVKRLLTAPRTQPIPPNLETPGDSNEPDENSIPR
jgi:hypothetical protein